MKHDDNFYPLIAEDFQALAQSARELAKELSLERLLDKILDTASQLTHSSGASIILRNERQPTLYFAAATGDEADWVLSSFGRHSEKQIPIVDSKAGMVYTTGVSIVENVVKNHFGDVDDETKTITKSMICVPLTVGERRLGVMQVLNKQEGDYMERDRIILEYFADQASVAIRNARLLESLLAHSGLYGASRNTDDLLARMDDLEKAAHAEVLSILFVDMRGFTQLCQTLLNATLVQNRLSEFISMLSRAVIEHDGIVNKFLGDGVMALFQGDDYSVRAVKCAFFMVREFAHMKDRWNDESNQQLDFLDLGVGIATDQVILGGIGNKEVRDYTAIGTPVNLSSALVNIARNGKHILCDQMTRRNATSIIAQAEKQEDFMLRKPGQEVGVKYKCHHLLALNIDQQASVFISHSHKDKAYVEQQLLEPLKNCGVRTWYSADDIPKGALWTAEIRKAIAESNWMIVIVSEHSAGSKWVSREVDLGIAAGHLEERIIPIVLDDTNLREVNEYLGIMQSVNSTQPDDVVRILAERFSQITAGKNKTKPA